MRARPVAATAALVALPMTAQAKDAELIDRRTFDATASATASTIHVAGAMAGELGGYLDVTVTAADGTLPTAPGACEPVDVTAALTVSPCEQLDVSTTGEVCRHQFSPSTLIVNASFGDGDLTYTGTEHKKVKVVGDGLIAASNSLGFGFGASISVPVRW